jgi:hypothetical protein
MATKGITVTSAIMTISGRVSEAVAGTMVQEEVPLTLDILGREVLLVYAIDLNPSAPDNLIGTNTNSLGSLSTTTRTTIGDISNTNVLASSEKAIRSAAAAVNGVPFQDQSPETPTSSHLDYIGIVSTNDFFVQCQGQGNTNLMSTDWRMWCARAKVSADIYAALVQSETLSA